MELKLFDRLAGIVLGELDGDPTREDDQRLIESYSPTTGLDNERTRRIRDYLARYNRFAGVEFELRYYQILALLFTEVFLERAERGTESGRTLAYWMATGSGKTLVMHLNLLQYLDRLRPKKPAKVELLVTTPGVNLIEQHRRELEPLVGRIRGWVGCPVELILESTQALLGYPNDYFDLHPQSHTQRIVVVDEAHIGLSTREEGAFRRLRERLTRTNALLLEYSATFRNLNRRVQTAYEESIAFKYEYSQFFRDGYGKDHHFRRVAVDVAEAEKVNMREAFDVLEDKLGAYTRLHSYGRGLNGQGGRGRFPDRPLLAFMGNTVNDPAKDSEVSDIAKVLAFLAALPAPSKRALSSVFHGDVGGRLRVSHNRQSPDELLLSFGDGEYWGLVNVGRGDSFFSQLAIPGVEKRRVEILPRQYWFSGLDDASSRINVLLGSRKFAEGWNSFRLSVLGLINLGTARGNKIIQIFGRGVRLRGAERNGKRRYVEHFADYGGSDRGVDTDVRRLETLVVVSLRRTYLETFVREIADEVGTQATIDVDVDVNRLRLPSGRLGGFDAYKRLLPTVRLSGEVPSWIRVVMSNGRLKYSFVTGDATDIEDAELRRFSLATDYRADKRQQGVDVKVELLEVLDGDSDVDLVGLNRRMVRACEAARLQLYSSREGRLTEASVKDAIGFFTSIRYASSLDGKGESRAEILRRAEAIAGAAVEDFARRLRARVVHDIGTRKYVLDRPLRRPRGEAEGDVPRRYALSRGFPSQEELERYERDHGPRWRDRLLRDLRVDDLGPHVYEPLVASPEGAEGLSPERRAELGDVTIRPDALNAGERKFVADLVEYVAAKPSAIRGYELFLLRNLFRLSQIGVYLESEEHPFYPDFALWAVPRKTRRGATHLFFVDPKGQTGMVDATTLEMNAKVRLGMKTSKPLKDLSRRLSETNGRAVRVHSFLLLRDSSALGREQSRNEDEHWLRSNLVERSVLRLDWHRLRENGDASDFHGLFGGRSYLDLMFDRVASA